MIKKKFIYLLLLFIPVSFINAQEKNHRADSLQKIADSLMKRVEALKKTADSLRMHPDSFRVWRKGGTFNIGGTQVSLSDWAAGGQNSIAIGSIFNGFINLKKEKANWDNNLIMQYGIIKQGGIKEWWKNDDQFQATSKLGFKASKHWYYSALLDFKSQFTPGFTYPNDSVRISAFLAPGYGILALGMDFKVEEYFAILFAPATGKFTIVKDQALANAGAFGVTAAETDTAGNVLKPGKKIRAEIGGYVKLKFKKDLFKNFSFETNLELFSNYQVKPENIDVMWTTITSLKINKFLTFSVNTHVIYDDDVKVPVDRDGDGIREGTGPRLQYKQVVALAFSVKL